jgi:outer membrane protein OmpA-like peptidoglycan-associated protein
MSHETTGTDRNSKAAFSELRGLLLGPEQEDIRRLKQKLEQANTAEQISRSLADAIRIAANRDLKLRSALQPIVDHGIRVSVRRDPSVISDALFPMIKDAVGKAVTTAFRQLVQTLNQTIEQSLSLRSVTWRWEAFRTGKSYGEIVVLRSLLYRVEQVLLIHRETGLLLAQRAFEPGITQDAELVSAMLTAIRNFISDSFDLGGRNELETVETDGFIIWVQQSPQAILAAVIRGIPPKALKALFQSVLQNICSAQAQALAKFEGDSAPFQACQKDLARCFVGSGTRVRNRAPWLLWAALALIPILLTSWTYVAIRESRRWHDFVDAVKREPGIVVVETGKRGGKYAIWGLRDPLARDPAVLLKQTGLSPGNVLLQWESYMSMQQPFAGIRQFAAAKLAVERRKIYFPFDSFQITPEEMDAINEAADDIKSLLGSAARNGRTVKVELIGNTDSSGSEQRNARLSSERAAEVLASLVSLGVPASALSTRGVGISENAWTGSSAVETALHRSVSFRVVSG